MSDYDEAYLAECQRLADNVDDLLQYLEERKKPKIKPKVTPEWQARHDETLREAKKRADLYTAQQKIERARLQRLAKIRLMDRIWKSQRGDSDSGIDTRYALHCEIPEQIWGVDHRDMKAFEFFPWLKNRSNGEINV